MELNHNTVKQKNFISGTKVPEKLVNRPVVLQHVFTHQQLTASSGMKAMNINEK